MVASPGYHGAMTADLKNPPLESLSEARHGILKRGPTLHIAVAASWILLMLMVIESIAGLVIDGLYPEDTWAVAALRGNDLVTLGVVAPLLLAGVAMRGRASGWVLVWLSGLLYGVYNFAYYAFGAAFNDIFLLHVSSLALSIGALIALAADIDAGAVGRVNARAPLIRAASVYMILVGTALIVAWGGFSVRFAITGELPADVMPPEAVHLVYAIDMSLLAPAFLTGGILLWRGSDWARILGVAVNLSGAMYLIVLEVVGGFQANAGIAGRTWVSMPSIVGSILCAAAALAVWRSGSGKSKGPEVSPRPLATE